MSLRGGHRPTWQSVPPCLPLGEGARGTRADEGNLPLPMGEVPQRGGEGSICPLSHFVTAPPEWEPRNTDCDRRESLERVTSVTSLNYGMIATGNHQYSNSLRGAPPLVSKGSLRRPMAAPTDSYDHFAIFSGFSFRPGWLLLTHPRGSAGSAGRRGHPATANPGKSDLPPTWVSHSEIPG